jgi:hypothetical protein
MSPEYHHSGGDGEYAATASFDVDIQALQRDNPEGIIILACCHELPPKLRHDRLLCES